MQIAPYRTNWFFSAMKTILATRLGSWFFGRTLHIFDRFIGRMSGGRTSFTELFGGVPVITLTTIGAKSGLPRMTTLLGLTKAEKIILIATNYGRSHHPAWYLNLKANPNVTVTHKGRTESYRADEAQGEEREQSWRIAVKCYPGYENYRKWAGARQIPVILLSPTQS